VELKGSSVESQPNDMKAVVAADKANDLSEKASSVRRDGQKDDGLEMDNQSSDGEGNMA
jgi:hypothetical protein